MPGSPTTPLLSLCLATHNRARYLDCYLTHHISCDIVRVMERFPIFPAAKA
jgi:hypothetical protein